jgi:ATP-dependent protease ClpP protease subunit
MFLAHLLRLVSAVRTRQDRNVRAEREDHPATDDRSSAFFKRRQNQRRWQAVEHISRDVDRDYILDPSQAVAYGLIDRVIVSSRDAKPAAVRKEVTQLS